MQKYAEYHKIIGNGGNMQKCESCDLDQKSLK